MNNKLSKVGANNEIEKFFENIKNKTPKSVKKIQRLAMAKKIPLKEKRKLFCKKCLVPYSGKEMIRIKNKAKTITCINCNYKSKWDLK